VHVDDTSSSPVPASLATNRPGTLSGVTVMLMMSVVGKPRPNGRTDTFFIMGLNPKCRNRAGTPRMGNTSPLGTAQGAAIFTEGMLGLAPALA
jgi:hypothetical protein